MDKNKPKEEKKTEFKGPISLEAILAAKAKSNGVEIKEPVIEPKKTVEPKKEEPAATEPKKEDVVIEEPKKKQEPIKEPILEVEETNAFKTAKTLIGLGVLKDFRIQVSEEDEEGTLISEFTSMTEDNLKEIVAISQEDNDNNISSNYISKEGLREHELKVIEILKNGGDLSQVADTKEKAFQRPFEGFDLDVRERQIDILYTDLVNGKGLDHESAVSLIQAKEQKGVLAAEAKKVFDLYRKAHSDYIDSILENQKKDKEFKELNFKENKKLLTSKLKEAGLKESAYKKVVSEYAKRNEKGEFLLVEKLKEALNNPEENHELILHLADKKIFNESFKIKSAHETQKTIVRLASSSVNKGNKKTIKSQLPDTKAPWLKAAENYNSTIK